MDALPNAPSLDAALEEARARFVAANPASARQHAEAEAVMPGGNTRSVLFYEPFPLAMARGEGCWLWDADGHRYLDLLGEFTAGLYGHSNPVIRAAIGRALDGGINLGGHNLLEARLAKLICDRFPAMEQLRFTNTGTESNLMAVALAKAATGRPRILVFQGAYHGGVLSFGAGPSAVNVPHEVVMAPYNDTAAAERLIAEQGDRLAAVLVEPMLGAGGCIPADPEFLHALRAATRRTGALLILDEVMTSRLSAGGRQALLGLEPDLTTLGKYLGGGMSFGAFGGRADLMALFDPRRPGALGHAGTFNNNVLSMAAGIAGLTEIFTPEAAAALTARGEALRARINARCAAQGVAMQASGIGSLMNIHFTARPIRNPSDAACDGRLRDLFFFDMVESGIYLARRGLIALMLPVGDAEEARFLAALDAFIARRQPHLMG
ncbi:aspartate aminotransferase family protein [Roseomonas sp. OT10]|uniref:aspartate aminotransferase family protein n=1 Tax=Roseomonas cutis TaxID=2897332 RepID=UPI001E3B76CD|nr:aspartate aminotransferase family protein [Roseomonas sp. OT10]UFN49973.1 aspartate aminotransferase family protein [Roseomonas sp. OT10]